MRSTIDKAGRLVISKPLRDQLGLTATVELEADGAGLRVQPVAGEGLDRRAGRLVIPAAEGVQLSDDDVRALRDVDQR